MGFFMKMLAPTEEMVGKNCVTLNLIFRRTAKVKLTVNAIRLCIKTTRIESTFRLPRVIVFKTRLSQNVNGSHAHSARGVFPRGVKHFYRGDKNKRNALRFGHDGG